MAAKEGNTSEVLSHKVLRKMRAEKESVLPKGFADTIENDLTGSGKYAITRRLAMAYLERPWPESTKNLIKNRKTADALAAVAENLAVVVEQYKSLVGWMETAHVRMVAALATRADFDELLKHGKRAQAKADHEEAARTKPKRVKRKA